MRSLICSLPGSFLYKEMDVPVLRPHHAIIKIKRIGICGTDIHAYQGTQPYIDYPRILGHELSGDLIDADDADGFVPGEKLTIIPYFHCGICIACRNKKPNCCVKLKVCGVHIDGGMVDYLCVPSAALVHNDGLNYDELALIEPLAIGAHGLRRANLIPNEFVLVIGAGPIGLGTMEFARIAGGQVIAMDNNDDRLAFCKKNLNVEHIIYASKDNVAGKLIEITNGDMPTVVIDATGNQQAINKGLTYLAHGGKYILIGLQKNEIILSHPEFHRREATLMSSRNASRQDFEMVISCVKKKLIDPSVYITHREKFEKVADEFNSWLDPKNHVIKAMVEMD